MDKLSLFAFEIWNYFNPLSDHMPIYLAINIKQPKSNHEYQFRSYTNNNMGKSNQTLEKFDISDILNKNDANVALIY